jgi:hypothetical protein
VPDFIRNPRETWLAQTQLEVEAEGFQPGTPQFESKLRQRQVEACQVYQQVPNCSVCPAFDGCDMAKKHLMDIRYGVQVP